MNEIKPAELDCPECGAPMILRHTNKFKTRDGQPRMFYGCSRWPDCTGTHGAHPDGRPFGTPANAALKALRRRTHEAMEQWAELNCLDTIPEQYERLKDDFGAEIHIGECDEAGCRRLLRYFETGRVR